MPRPPQPAFGGVDLPDQRPDLVHDLLPLLGQFRLRFRVGSFPLGRDALGIERKAPLYQWFQLGPHLLLPRVVPRQFAQMAQHLSHTLHRIAVMDQITLPAAHDETPTRRLRIRQTQDQFLNRSEDLMRLRHPIMSAR